jgi:hypothetical protein
MRGFLRVSIAKSEKKTKEVKISRFQDLGFSK